MPKIAALGISVLLFSGCSETFDYIAVALNNATTDINRSNQTIYMPLGLFPHTEFKLKGTGIAIEQNF